MRKVDKRGTTMVELMVAIAILSMIMLPVYVVLSMGYEQFYIENSNMQAQKSAREIIDMILEDLRMGENEFTEADNSSGRLLTIKDSFHFADDELIYSYLPEQNMIYKNDIPILEGDGVKVVNFNVEQTIMDYDSWIIEISISVKTEKSDVISLKSSYRTKVKLLPTPT